MSKDGHSSQAQDQHRCVADVMDAAPPLAQSQQVRGLAARGLAQPGRVGSGLRSQMACRTILLPSWPTFQPVVSPCAVPLSSRVEAGGPPRLGHQRTRRGFVPGPDASRAVQLTSSTTSHPSLMSFAPAPGGCRRRPETRLCRPAVCSVPAGGFAGLVRRGQLSLPGRRQHFLGHQTAALSGIHR